MATEAELLEMIAGQRRDIASMLEGLTEAQGDTPSLCTGWSVKQVAIHLTVPLHVSLPKIMLKMAANLGDFDKTMVKLVARESARPLADVANELRAQAANDFTPPGMGLIGPLHDVLVHTQDMRRPLGLGTDLDADRLRVTLESLSDPKVAKFVGARKKRTLEGIRYEATDVGVSLGSGASVTGPGEAVLMAVSGRAGALDDLSGDGVAVVRSRLAA